MSRVQLALNVSDIDEAVEFYSKLFSAGPAKRMLGYANFAIDEPPLKLVLIEKADAREDGVAGALNHLGVEVFSTDEVQQATDRLTNEGLLIAVEDSTTCCYAVQDKVWVHDPDGLEWETYVVLEDADVSTGLQGSGDCCAAADSGSLPFGAAAHIDLLLRLRVREQALWRRLLAEFLGSTFLAGIVIGSGIAAQQLSPGDIGLELFENAATTAAGLFAIILMFGPVSGAHFNPVVSFVDAAFGGLSWRNAGAYLPTQVAGCTAGAVIANFMFSKAAISISTKHRASGAHFLAEVVATVGLLLVIFALARTRRGASAPAAVGAYIGAAYLFTSSTSFANPAITVGRMFSDTFAGIAPSSAPVYIAAQIVGAIVAFGAIKALYPNVTPAEAADIVVPHHGETIRVLSNGSQRATDASVSATDAQ